MNTKIKGVVRSALWHKTQQSWMHKEKQINGCTYRGSYVGGVKKNQYPKKGASCLFRVVLINTYVKHVLTQRRRKMLETIAWAVLLMCLGGVVVVIVAVSIFMLNKED